MFILFKNNFLKIFFFISIALFLGSCHTQYISYDRDEILKKYSDYETFLNGKEIAFDTIYLDEENIDSFKIYTQEKKIYVTQINKDVEYLSLQNILLDNDFGNDCIVIVNGSLNENFKTMKKIEMSAIEECEISRNLDLLFTDKLLIIDLK